MCNKIRPLGERGQSAMEVLLSLPFFLLVMLLGINFGKAYLLKQEVTVGARYAAWRDGRTRQTTTDATLDQAGYGGYQMRTTKLDAADLSAQASRDASGLLGAVASRLGSFGGGSGGTTAYRVSYTWQPLGRALPEGTPAGEHYVVMEDWHCGSGGNYLSGTGAIVGGLDRFFGSVFKTC